MRSLESEIEIQRLRATELERQIEELRADKSRDEAIKKKDDEQMQKLKALLVKTKKELAEKKQYAQLKEKEDLDSRSAVRC